LGNVGLGANIGYGYGYGDFGFANVGFLPQYGVYNPGYYGVPTLFPSFNTGYYPPGVWPSPVVTQPIYPTPYIPEIPEAVDPGISPQDMILAAELARISEQLQALRNQQAAPVAVPAPQQQPQPPSTQGPSQEKPSAATVLIMRDGRRIETQSYAIADQMLWVFDQGTTLRFSMADVDVDATRAENSRRGIRFLVG
jgi:hypothetical protein